MSPGIRVLPAPSFTSIHCCDGEIQLDHTLAGDVGRCKPAPPWYRGGAWWCHHREVCRHCGRVLRHGINMYECPDYTPAKLKELNQWPKQPRSKRRRRPAMSAARSRRSA